MDRIALFTAECTQLNAALREFILLHRKQLAVVVTSELGGHDPVSFTRQGLLQGRRSGLHFVNYLLLTFTGYFWFARYDRLRSALTGAPRRCVTVAELCRALGIRHLHTDAINSPATERVLREAQLDFIVIYWFDQIIHENIIQLPRKAVVNFHAAYLPNCRGLFPVFYSAIYNDGIYGVTAHEIEDREIDAGPILAQLRVELDPAASRSALYRDAIVNRAGVEFAAEVIANFDAHHAARFTPEQPGSYHSFPTRQEISSARRQGMPLSSIRDYLAICRGELPER